MKKQIMFIVMFGIILISASFVSASGEVHFFYSPTCPHCQAVIPFVNQMIDLYTSWKFIVLDVTQGSYGVNGVPQIVITTSDNREIVLGGSKEIPERLNCELQEMTTKDCQTFSADTCINGSWFK